MTLSMQNEILSSERVRRLDESASSANEPKQIAVSFVTSVARRTTQRFLDERIHRSWPATPSSLRRGSLARNSSYSLRHGINHASPREDTSVEKKGGKRISKERKETGDKFRAAFRRGACIPRVSLSSLSQALPHREGNENKNTRNGN